MAIAENSPRGDSQVLAHGDDEKGQAVAAYARSGHSGGEGYEDDEPAVEEPSSVDSSRYPVGGCHCTSMLLCISQ